MKHIVEPRQMMLADPYEHVFSPVAYKKVRAGWQGVFRHVILELLPAEALARSFSDELGRPTKEIYSMAGLVFIMQFNNWTAEQAADAYMFDTAIQYALNLSPGAQSMCSRTLERYLKLVREDGLAGRIMDDVTSALVSVLDKNVREQRLDSTHVFSNMALFGRTQLMGVAVRRFLSQVRRHDRAAYDALPEELRARYAPSEQRLFGDTQRDQAARSQLRRQVAEDMYALIVRFSDDKLHNTRRAYLALTRVFEEQCDIQERKTVVKEKTGGRVMQNPSDPDATYDGKKGPGYQVQLSETCDSNSEVQLITAAVPQSAADTDAQSVAPVCEHIKAQGHQPSTLLADAAYGSDDNVQQLSQEGTALISPVNCSKRDPDKLHIDDFDTDPETECITRCPEGHAPLQSQHHAQDGVTTTYFDAAHCRCCARRSRCPVEGNERRRFRHTKAQRRGAARLREERSESWRKTYAKRAGIEGAIGRIKRRTGLGRLKVRGQAAVYMAILLKVAGWNILQAAKVWYKRLNGAEKSVGAYGDTIADLIRRVLDAAIQKKRLAMFAINRIIRKNETSRILHAGRRGLLSALSSKGEFERLGRLWKSRPYCIAGVWREIILDPALNHR